MLGMNKSQVFLREKFSIAHRGDQFEYESRRVYILVGSQVAQALERHRPGSKFLRLGV